MRIILILLSLSLSLSFNLNLYAFSVSYSGVKQAFKDYTSIYKHIVETKHIQGYKQNKRLLENVNTFILSIAINSLKYDIDPIIITSIIMKESSFRSKIIHKNSGAMGSMQVMPSVWVDKLISENIIEKESDLLNIYHGINAGCYVFKHYYDITQNKRKALARYFGVCSYSEIYTNKVMSVYLKLTDKI